MNIVGQHLRPLEYHAAMTEEVIAVSARFCMLICLNPTREIYQLRFPTKLWISHYFPLRFHPHFRPCLRPPVRLHPRLQPHRRTLRIERRSGRGRLVQGKAAHRSEDRHLGLYRHCAVGGGDWGHAEHKRGEEGWYFFKKKCFTVYILHFLCGKRFCTWLKVWTVLLKDAP